MGNACDSCCCCKNSTATTTNNEYRPAPPVPSESVVVQYRRTRIQVEFTGSEPISNLTNKIASRLNTPAASLYFIANARPISAAEGMQSCREFGLVNGSQVLIAPRAVGGNEDLSIEC